MVMTRSCGLPLRMLLLLFSILFNHKLHT